MNKVKVLSEEVANRIAAGEVIERPVSIVKELVENSIDAKADKITISLEKGGKKLIQVIDNGCGMSEDDALQCFERHATSKIRTVSDIFSINTLGFRGEALPSITSISNLIMVTKDNDDNDNDMASRAEFRSGQLINFSKTSGNKGTNIVVKNLFGNVPARKKFLKSDNVEYKHILNFLHQQAILHPDIHFKLISNGYERLNYPKADTQEERMAVIFGSEFLKKDLIKINISKDNLAISGYISGLEEDQNSLLDFHYVFVNGRYVKDKIIFHSIRSAYEPFLKKIRIFQQGKLPPYIIFLELDPSMVDFNVHPAKLEIRFVDPGNIHYFVKTTLTQSLLDYENRRFNQVKEVLYNNETKSIPQSSDIKIFNDKTDKKYFERIKKEESKYSQPDMFQPLEQKHQSQIPPKKSFYKKETEILLRPEEDVVNPWQLHQSYIFVQVQDGLMVIDQHAAHERILYEKIIHRIHGAPAETQKLLFPLVVDIPPYLASTISELISENIDVFRQIGFSIKTFSGNSIVIDEIPVELKDWDGGDIFVEILKTLQDEFQETTDFRDSIAKSVSCKSAIKAGQKLSKREMLNLINDLFACDVPYFCPHGRPLIIKMTMQEFEKRFKRII